MRQDPTFKDILAYPFMVEELVRWFVGDLRGARALVDELDFARLERLPEQSTTGPAQDKRAYANDIVWGVPFRGRPGPGRHPDWLRLVLMVEVQGRVDHLMALRIRNYVDNHHMELWRGKRFGAKDRLAPVLPVVVHTGPTRWTAAPRVIDLVSPAHDAGPEPGPGSLRSGLFAGDGYLTLDTARLAEDDLRYDNAAALLAGLCNPRRESLPAMVAALRERLDAPPLRPLLEVLLRWAEHTARLRTGMNLGDNMAEVDSYEAGDLEAHYALRRRVYQHRFRKEGIAQGIEQGMARGGRALLRRQALRKFGADAENLGPLLADIGDPDALETVGEWIIDCGTLDELLARLEGLG